MFFLPNTKSQIPATQEGFTLVEMTVAISIFTFIVLIIGSTFLNTFNIQRRALNIQQVEENVTYVLESMTKELRLSRFDASSPNNNCPASPATSIRAVNQDGDNIRYFLSNGQLHREINSITDTVVSSDTVAFDRIVFCFSGIGIDQKQQLVTITGRIRSVNTKNQASMDFQTTVSARLLSD